MALMRWLWMRWTRICVAGLPKPRLLGILVVWALDKCLIASGCPQCALVLKLDATKFSPLASSSVVHNIFERCALERSFQRATKSGPNNLSIFPSFHPRYLCATRAFCSIVPLSDRCIGCRSSALNCVDRFKLLGNIVDNGVGPITTHLLFNFFLIASSSHFFKVESAPRSHLPKVFCKVVTSLYCCFLRTSPMPVTHGCVNNHIYR